MYRLFDEEITIKNQGYFYLDDILKQKEYKDVYLDMMNTRLNHISFLNKGLCGNGGTTGLIRYALDNNNGLLVLVPNVSICKSKETEYHDNPNVCVVYGGSNNFNPDAQVVIATYDQFKKLLSKLKSFGINTGQDIWDIEFWGGRTIVVDEYHKIIDDSGYRSICHKMTEMISSTESPVILMSATPNNDYIKMIRKLLPERTIYSYDVQYSGLQQTNIDIYEVKFKDLKNILKTILDDNQQVCVFYNCVKDIKTILGQIGDDRCEVLCSADSKNKVGKYYSDAFNEKKKLHFMTSAYYAGHDIWTHVDKCIIVGSGEFDYMALSEKDIKQIIGRFRVKNGVRMDGVKLFFMKKSANQKNYMLHKNTYDRIKKDIKILGDKWMKLSGGISMMHDLLRTKDALRRFEAWKDNKGLEKMLVDYGFSVNIIKTDFLQGIQVNKQRKHLSFEHAKQKLKLGESVDFDEYPDIDELMAYKEVKGINELMSKRTSKQDIHNWYRAYMISQGKDLNVEKNKLPEIFGIKNFGRYNAKYLLACLMFLDDKSNYDNLAVNMYEKMGCYAIPWSLDDNGHKQNNTWLVISLTSNFGGENDHSLIRKESNLPPKFEEMVIKMKVSHETSNSGSSYAKTISFGDLTKGKIASLKRIPLYDWINQDKEHRLPLEKKTKDWMNIKLFKQTKISDMYKNTDNVYRYIRSEMDLVDCLIIDVDGGLSYDEFAEKYQRWAWFAYPTLNNIPPDNWTKFRVIVPLAHTIKIDGDHNLKVLKMIRTMFCPYEDTNHQVYSFINFEDFIRLKSNDGEVYDIPQDFVNDLGISMKESIDYNNRKFDKKNIDYSTLDTAGTSLNMSLNMTLDRAKSLFLSALVDPTEGARHKILYPIKKHLSVADREWFGSWLAYMHPDYMKHWNSHRV